MNPAALKLEAGNHSFQKKISEAAALELNAEQPFSEGMFEIFSD